MILLGLAVEVSVYVGLELGGRYRLDERIGRGGMGEVWHACDLRLDRSVAVKVLPLSGEAGPEEVARFRREAQLVASLQHPGITVVHDIDEDTAAHVLYLVMELLDGENLGRVLPAHAGMVPLRRALPRSPWGAPRARGDGPDCVEVAHARDVCSPRTRGWSPRDGFHAGGQAVLPAHARMVPIPGARRCRTVRAPRARGMVPSAAKSSKRSCCAPAHAGMNPAWASTVSIPSRAPRARGDGPRCFLRYGRMRCAPCARGDGSWSRSPRKPRASCSSARGMVPVEPAVGRGRWWSLRQIPHGIRTLAANLEYRAFE
jgi:hypothetical protein